jgi:hypothetical protein
MDFLLILILTFFAVLIGGLFLYSARATSSRNIHSLTGGDDVFNPAAMDASVAVEMQLEHIIEESGAKMPEGTHPFRYEFDAKAKFVALKESAPAAPLPEVVAGAEPVAPVPAGPESKALQSALMSRCLECLKCTIQFDGNARLIYDSYNNFVPREVIAFLEAVKVVLDGEIAEVKQEAELLKLGWGNQIFPQVHDMTVGLAQRKAQRAAMEAQQQGQAQTMVSAAAQQKKQAETAIATAARQQIEKVEAAKRAVEKQAADSEKAYAQLMAEGGSSAKKKAAPKSVVSPTASKK